MVAFRPRLAARADRPAARAVMVERPKMSRPHAPFTMALLLR